MASFSFDLAASTYGVRVVGSATTRNWEPPRNGRPSVPSALTDGSARFVGLISIQSGGPIAGAIILHLTATNSETLSGTTRNQDLSTTFEASGTITLTHATAGAITWELAGASTAEPYAFPAADNGLTPWIQALIAAADKSISVTLDDGAGATPDTTAPTLTAAAVNGATLVLTYDEALDTSSVPATSAFDVTVAGSDRSVSRVAVAGSAVTLTLSSAVTQGQTVTVDYFAPVLAPIQDAAGNEVADLSNEAVTNNTGVVLSDAVAPTLTIAAVTNVTEGESHTFRVTPNGGTYDTISYQWAVVRGGGSIGATTGVYRAPLVNADVTDAQVRVTATARGTGTEAVNNTSATSTDTETFTIKNVPKGTRPTVNLTSLTWHDAAPTLTDATPKLWVAQRRVPGSPAAGAAKQASWGDWTTPEVTSLMGGGLEFIFAVTSSTTAPALPNNSWGFDQPISPWFDAAPVVSASNPYLWMSQRPLVGTPRIGDSVAGTWTDPRIVSHFGQDGQDGEDGDAASIPDGGWPTTSIALGAITNVYNATGKVNDLGGNWRDVVFVNVPRVVGAGAIVTGGWGGDFDKPTNNTDISHDTALVWQNVAGSGGENLGEYRSSDTGEDTLIGTTLSIGTTLVSGTGTGRAILRVRRGDATNGRVDVLAAWINVFIGKR